MSPNNAEDTQPTRAQAGRSSPTWARSGQAKPIDIQRPVDHPVTQEWAIAAELPAKTRAPRYPAEIATLRQAASDGRPRERRFGDRRSANLARRRLRYLAGKEHIKITSRITGSSDGKVTLTFTAHRAHKEDE